MSSSTTKPTRRRLAVGAVSFVSATLYAAPAWAADPDRTDAVEFDSTNIQNFTNELSYIALLFCVGGIFVSAALWALGNKGQNPGTELTGKKGMIVCCTAAFFIGALPAFINYLEDTAQEIDENGVTRGSPAGNPVQVAPAQPAPGAPPPVAPEDRTEIYRPPYVRQ